MRILTLAKKRVLAHIAILQNRANSRQFWIHPENARREIAGDQLKLDRLHKNFPDRFKRAVRLTPEQFDELLLLTQSSLQKDEARRGCISPKVRLYVTLKYLAHGTSMQQLAESFCMGISTVSSIVSVTTRVIWNVLSSHYMPVPTRSHWRNIAQDFGRLWNFPHCVGALDGKHVYIQRPNNSGSMYFNYKKTFSINLMATCDAYYRFTMIDVGGYGRSNDSGVFRSCPMGKQLLAGQLNLPEPEMLPDSTLEFPYVFVADDAFPMMECLLKPYPGNLSDGKSRIYNYRLSRARRTIENSFGILASRFRIFRRPIIGKPENVDYVIKATCVLHNYLRTWHMDNKTSYYFGSADVDIEDQNGNVVNPAAWRKHRTDAFIPIKKRLGSNNFCQKVRILRNNLANYFVTNNVVDWQQQYVKTASWNPVGVVI